MTINFKDAVKLKENFQFLPKISKAAWIILLKFCVFFKVLSKYTYIY